MTDVEKDHNFVADAQNWCVRGAVFVRGRRREARVKTELDASKQWYSDWGSLFAPDEPANYDERITKLRERASRIPGARLETNNAAYGCGKPFKDFAKVQVKRKPDII